MINNSFLIKVKVAAHKFYSPVFGTNLNHLKKHKAKKTVRFLKRRRDSITADGNVYLAKTAILPDVFLCALRCWWRQQRKLRWQRGVSAERIFVESFA
jgi:hypothetical protein